MQKTGHMYVSYPFPLLTMLRNNEQKLHQAMLWVCNIVWEERGILNTLFKIPIIFCYWLSKIYKKKRLVPCMLFQKTQMSFNESDYVMKHPAMNIMTANSAKTAQKNATIFLSYYYLVLVGKGLLQAHNDKCCSLVKLLCIDFCYFILLNHSYQCLTIFFFQTLCVIGKISIRWSGKKHQTTGKVEM